jgi:sulfoacetaldehyde acetyltransferase
VDKVRMTSGEALVESLVAEGVDTVWGIVGSAFMDALDLFPQAGIRFVSVAHEQAAAHAADGMARVTGRPQVCIGQNGPGVANFVSGVAAAYWAHTPMVAITPEAGTAGMGHGGFQEIDQMPMFAEQTVYQVRVNRPDRMAELTRRCFYMAKVARGPAQLNIPRDFFYGEADYEVYPSPTIEHGPGARDAIDAVANEVVEARRVVILAGGGVVQAGAVAEIEALAEYLSLPVVNTYLHNDSFPNAHPLAVGPIGYCGSKAAMRTIADADLVLALGTRLGPFGTLPQYGMAYWPEEATVVQVDVDPAVLGLSRRVEYPVLADVKAFTRALLDAIKGLRPDVAPDRDRRAAIAREKAAWAEEKASASNSSQSPMHPRRFLSELAQVIPTDAVMTTDIGNTCSMSNDYFHFSEPRRHLAALSWGNCGFAMGAAMGAKLGLPDTPVFSFQGDGAYGIGGLAEVMTLVREQIPVIAIVANNLEWGAEKKNQIDYFDERFVGTNLRENPDYARLARDMGAVGIRVTDPADVQDAVREAMASGRPAVIEGVIQGGKDVLAEPFRRDALRKPERLLPKYRVGTPV